MLLNAGRRSSVFGVLRVSVSERRGTRVRAHVHTHSRAQAHTSNLHAILLTRSVDIGFKQLLAQLIIGCLFAKDCGEHACNALQNGVSEGPGTCRARKHVQPDVSSHART